MRAVAIDGPSGAGKSTIARFVAARLGYIYIDTGALYRAIGLYALQNGFDPKVAGQMESCLPHIDIEIVFLNQRQRVYLNTEDVSELLRTPEVSMAASAVSAHKCVRDFLFDLQKELARKNNVVMDGRDIGTVVLPGADVKIFLTASSEERARRRYDELVEKGETVTYEEVLSDLIERDRNDSTRVVAPLKKADDAVEVDTTGNTLEQSQQMVAQEVCQRLGL